MNPGMKLLLVMLIALEISFTQSLVVNCILIAVSLVYILTQHVSMKALFGIIFWPLFPAVDCSYLNGCMVVLGFILPGSCSPGSTDMYFWVPPSR